MENDDGLELLLVRRRRGLKQWELAALVGVSPPTLSAVENGHRPLTPELRERIERVLQQKLD